MVSFESLGAVSYSPSIVMALSCLSSEIKRVTGRKSWLFHTPLAFDAPVRGSPSEYCHAVWCGKTRLVGLPFGGKTLRMCNRLDTIPACDWRTDRQTSCHVIVRAMHTRRAVKTIMPSVQCWFAVRTVRACNMLHAMYRVFGCEWAPVWSLRGEEGGEGAGGVHLSKAARST